jgi:hypothetical protein
MIAPYLCIARFGRGREWLKARATNHSQPNLVKALLTDIPLKRGLIRTVYNVGGFFSVGSDRNSEH